LSNFISSITRYYDDDEWEDGDHTVSEANH
jgi:hypothetical protein